MIISKINIQQARILIRRPRNPIKNWRALKNLLGSLERNAIHPCEASGTLYCLGIRSARGLTMANLSPLFFLLLSIAASFSMPIGTTIAP
jgi:hypothetical protein